jgi:peptide/nickel transport system substrate-binding protein
MRGFLSWHLGIVLVIALLLALSSEVAMRPAGHSAASSLASDPHTLIVARDISDGKTMDPGRMYEFTSAAMASNVYEQLVTYRGKDVSHPQKMLATSWTISDGGRVFTFHLRHGVRFSNGDPMTASDVVFSYRRLGYLNDNPAFLMGATQVGKKITIYQVRALNKYTVQFTLPAPDVSFLAALADVNFGVLDAKVVREHGGDDSPEAATKDKATAWLNEHSIGTGPFMMTQWVRGASGQIVMKRNPYYWGKRPYLNEIIFQGVTNATTQRLEVSRGTVDIAANIDIDGARMLHSDPNVKVITGNTLDLVYIGMTTNPKISKPLSNPLVRQAVRHALDYNGIINGLLSGVGTQPNSMIPVGLLGNSPAVNVKLRPQTDLTLARALMKKAGYPHGFAVTMYYDGGVTFDGVSYDLLAPKVAHDLGQIGIKVKLNPEQDTVLLPAYRAGKLPMVLYNWGVDFPDPNDFAGPFSPGGGPAKRMWYTWDHRLTDLVTRADSVSNPKTRARLYLKIQQIWLKESPWVGVVQPKGIVVLHRGVTGYTYSPMFQNDFRYVKKSG